jgi:FKBP-type peptidyl-prolyl cis-trans isomerase FkpA
MEFHLVVKTGNDSVLTDTYKDKEPIFIPLEASPYPGSFQEGLLMLAKGDSADFLVDVDTMFKEGRGRRPGFLAAGSKLKFNVKVLDVVSREEFTKRMQKKSEEAQAKESVDLKAYLEMNQITPKVTPSGLMYVIEKETKGRQAKAGDTVAVHYTGTFLNGTKFDSSVDKGRPFEFIIGKGMVIPGWDEGVALMKVGEKYRFFIPSNLGYGPGGEPRGGIPPFSTLVFEVELIK